MEHRLVKTRCIKCNHIFETKIWSNESVLKLTPSERICPRCKEKNKTEAA